MYFLFLVIILLSSAGIIFVLGAKIVEIKSGNAGFLSRLSGSFDPALRQSIEKIKLGLSHFNMTNTRKVFTIGTHKLFHLFGTAGLFVSGHYKHLTSRINGRRVLKGGGVVSFFLKNVAESKGEDEKKL